MSDFGFYSAKEMFEKQFESREPIIDQILHEKDSVIFAGKPKTGKSVLLFQLICSLTSCEPFMDRFEVKRKCKVVYIQLEGSMSDSKDRFVRMTKALALNNDNFFIYFSPPLQLNTGEAMNALIKEIEAKMGRPDVVIIDPLYFAMKGSLSDDEVVRAFTGNMRVLQEYFDCSCILVHHFKKAKKDESGKILPPDDDDVFGSVFFQAWITHQFLFDVDRSSKVRTMQCNIQRSGKILDKISLKMIEPEPLYFEEVGHWPTKSETLYKYFTANPGETFTAREVYAKIDMAKSSFYKHIKETLTQDGIFCVMKNGERAYTYSPTLLEEKKKLKDSV